MLLLQYLPYQNATAQELPPPISPLPLPVALCHSSFESCCVIPSVEVLGLWLNRDNPFLGLLQLRVLRLLPAPVEEVVLENLVGRRIGANRQVHGFTRSPKHCDKVSACSGA